MSTTTLQILAGVVWVVMGLKLAFITTTLLHKYVNYNKKSIFYKYDDKLVYISKITEFIFIAITCMLIIFLFHPRKNNMQYFTPEIKFIMYLFGWIVIITADWTDFFAMIKPKNAKYSSILHSQ